MNCFELLLIISALLIQEQSAYDDVEDRDRSLDFTGVKTVPKKHYKWMVALFHNNASRCSASVISDRLVLTAAHCLEGNLDAEFYTGHVGSANKYFPSQKLDFESVHMHPSYDNKTYDHDIGIMVTKSKISFDETVGPICISNRKKVFRNRDLVAFGWGDQPDGSDTTWLKKIKLQEDKSQNCPEHKICTNIIAGGLHGGDSGGPVVVMKKRVQVGVMSGGTDSYSQSINVSRHRGFIINLSRKLNTSVCFRR